MRIATGLAVVLLSGCVMQSQIPTPENEPLSYQMVMRASHHWDLMAADVADQVTASISLTGYKDRPLYVSAPGQHSEFGRAFHNLLVSQLVTNGTNVTTDPGALAVSFDAQVVAHNSARIAYRPGTLTALGAGLLVLRGIALHGSSGVKDAAFLALLAAGDVATAVHAGPPPRTEVIVTTSVKDGPRFVTRKTDIYYIQEADATLFLPHIAPPGPWLKDLRVTGDGK